MTSPSDRPGEAESNLGLLIRQAWRRRVGLSLVTVALIVGFGAVIAVLSLDRPVPPGGPHAAEQAGVIDAMLESSSAGRLFLLDAIDDINACAVDGTTTANIRAAAKQRQGLVTTISELVVNELPNGETIKTELRVAAQASYDADRAYLSWVLAAGSRCPKTSDPAYAAIVANNAAADSAKRALVADWNPVARSYGLPERSMTII